MSRESRTRLQARVNDSSASSDVDDKARFYSLCKKNSIEIPDTFGIIVGKNALFQAEACSDLPVISVGDLPIGGFVAKPAWGSKGKGLVFFEKSESVYRVGGKELDSEEVTTLLYGAALEDSLVLQRRITPHPMLSSITQSHAIQSVRIVTFLRDHATVDILFARFKYVCGGNDIDNFSDGDTGNLIANVDIGSGRIIKTFIKEPGVLGLLEVNTHPDTGKDLNIILPDWSELLALVRRAAQAFGRLRCLAWDIALTENGPVILEANQDWEIFPISPFHLPDGVSDLKEFIAKA